LDLNDELPVETLVLYIEISSKILELSLASDVPKRSLDVVSDGGLSLKYN
jgi:hypothetical protein